MVMVMVNNEGGGGDDDGNYIRQNKDKVVATVCNTDVELCFLGLNIITSLYLIGRLKCKPSNTLPVPWYDK